MKRAFRVLLIIIGIIVIGVIGLITYVNTAFPKVSSAPELTLEYTPERVARGKYLANAVTVCMDCHSKRDWTKYSGPITPGTLAIGGDRFDQSVGFPGVYYAKNITPAGISRYTDGELFRVITAGVSKEGHAMFPVMPYPNYGKMDPEDIYAIIAYLRSLAPVENEVPLSESDFPMSLIIKTLPADPHPGKRPDTTDILATGAYLANAAGCGECHTPVKNGQIIPELMFSGGREFPFPDGSVVRSLNITPATSGLGVLSESAFVDLFKGKRTTGAYAVKPGEFNTIMPWLMYADMKESDLRAIYQYLKSVKPIENEVVRFTPASANTR